MLLLVDVKYAADEKASNAPIQSQSQEDNEEVEDEEEKGEEYEEFIFITCIIIDCHAY